MNTDIVGRNTMNGTKPRLADDAYFTPDKLALAICRKLQVTIGDVANVVEPSAGSGAFVRAAWEVWPNAMVCAVEPNSPEMDAKGHWLSWFPKTWEETTCRPLQCAESLIVGNPPFSLAEEHIQLALSRLAPGAHACFLLRASMLAGKGRFETLHKNGCLRHVWHVIGRPAFTPDGKTDAAEYAVLVWQKGHSGPYEGGWLEWR